MLAGEYFLMCVRSKEKGVTNDVMGRQGQIQKPLKPLLR